MLRLGRPEAAPPPLPLTAEISLRSSVGTEADMHAQRNMHQTMPCREETSLPLLAGHLPMHARYGHDDMMSIEPGVLPLIQAGLRCNAAERPCTSSPCAENPRPICTKTL